MNVLLMPCDLQEGPAVNAFPLDADPITSIYIINDCMALSLVPPILVIPQLHQNIFTQVYSIIVCHRKSDVDTFFTHGMRALYAKFLDLRLVTFGSTWFYVL